MKRVALGILLVFLAALTTYFYPKIQQSHEPSLRLHRLPSTLALVCYINQTFLLKLVY